MTCSPEERAQKERFEALYVRAQSPVMLSIERRVCGCDYGGSSWTTETEALRIAKHLGLRPGVRLLDLGAGSGWPGLYLAKRSGCDVTLVDLPVAGLRIALTRADSEGILDQVQAAVADGAALPFAAGAFDAISHSDLLCCLKQKRAVLAACRRVIHGHGRMAFTVISVRPGLSGESYRRVVANGPEFIETDSDYATLLAQTGWLITGQEDLTTAYLASSRRQLRADEAHAEELAALIGADAFAERLDGWRSSLAALDDNLLQRTLFIAVPGPE